MVYDTRMDEKDRDFIRESFLVALEESLVAQLRAVRRLRVEGPPRERRKPGQSMSQVSVVEEILRKAGKELHIDEIIKRAEKSHHISMDRDSIVSALTKRIQRADRFVRKAPNIFGLKDS
jgi:HB1/ASXL restriction endonuclease-like protein with HTH domain